MQSLENIINQAWEDRSMLTQKPVQEAIRQVVGSHLIKARLHAIRNQTIV